MWNIFHETDANKTEDILFKDVCAAISKTDTKLYTIMKRKIGRIENSIENIPDLSPFDLFVVQVNSLITFHLFFSSHI